MGFQRLSIIDTVSGNQPLYNEDGQVVLITNGEIYNYKELKEYLESKGHIFRTHSDCECLVHLYEEFGSDFVEKLNGMFAFCLYDRREKKLFLGRDRVGIKPLYYCCTEDVVVFGSEIKAILQATEIGTTESDGVLDEYLCFRYLSGSRTFFKGVKLLSPGTVLEVNPDGFQVNRFWELSAPEKSFLGNDVVTEIRKSLQDSVCRQLMSDVPLGTQLSGGVDSSWVSILAAREAPGMKSFSIGFAEIGFDETAEAKEVAARGGLEYHELISDPFSFASELPRIIWHNDEPLAHANSLEIHNLCRFAKKHVKVLLTGEGADELFGGYPRYYLCRLAESYQRLPSFLRPVFRFGLDVLARKRGKRPGFFLNMVPQDRVFWNALFCNPEKVAWLLDKQELEFGERRALLEQSWREGLHVLDNLLLFEFRSYLQPILLRQDKMSMGASIEARVPILDNEMIDLAFRIPAAEKIRKMQLKYLFKKAATADLPAKIVKKRKVGFGVPVGAWMQGNGSLSGFLDRLNDGCQYLPGVHPARLEKMIQEHRRGIKDHQDILWPLLNYAIWRDIYIEKKSTF